MAANLVELVEHHHDNRDVDSMHARKSSSELASVPFTRLMRMSTVGSYVPYADLPAEWTLRLCCCCCKYRT